MMLNLIAHELVYGKNEIGKFELCNYYLST
jgi:hypothetical protein